VLTGVLLLTIAGTWSYRSYDVERTWIETEGTIVDLVASSDGDTYAPIIEFSTSDGVVRRFEHTVFSTAAAEIGTSVDVLYDPADPDRAVVHSAAGFWIGPIVFGTVGVTALIITAILGFVIRRRDRSGGDAVRTGEQAVGPRPRRSAEYRRVETRIDSDGTFNWQIVAKADDGIEYRSDWLEQDPQMDLMANNYAVTLEQRGYDWVVVPV
jgi:hypothetical protein